VKSSLALTGGLRRTAVRRRILATVLGETVAVLEASRASNVASANHCASNRRGGAIRRLDVLGSAKRSAVKAVVRGISVTLWNTADAASRSGGTDIGSELAAVGNDAIAVVEPKRAVSGRLANASTASNRRADVGER